MLQYSPLTTEGYIMKYQECSNKSCGNPVFARGICRKHYDRERLAEADPCSIQECNAKSTKRGMCEAHYQAWRKTQTPICKIENCTEHSRGKKYGLCQKHEFRLRRHGSIEQPRPDDWGAREQHPLYKSWCWHKRASNLCDEWRDDFWAFANTLGVKPSNHTIRKKDASKPYSKDNWYWKESIDSSDKAKYARKLRATNHRRTKNVDLKRMYGITIRDYEQMFADQKGVCKICGKKEPRLEKNGASTSLAVDHCHATGKVRGLLCSLCNRGLGYFKDNPEFLKSAIKYLAKSNAY